MLIRMGGGYMDFYLIHERQQKLICILILSLCILFIGCYANDVQYPFQVSSKWQCESLDFSLSYYTNTAGKKLEVETLLWKDQVYQVNIAFGLGDFCVFPEYANIYDERLFAGTWYYKEDKLVLKIEEDFLFGDQFTELVFTPTDAE